eukprot:COSAG01_NODE_33093_length_570_cov_1.029724_1_plen_141_part_10
MAACSLGDIATVAGLVRGGVNPSQPVLTNGGTPLHVAAHCGHEALVQWLVEEAAVPPDGTATDGATPFFVACYRRHVAAARYLAAVPAVDVWRACSHRLGTAREMAEQAVAQQLPRAEEIVRMLDSLTDAHTITAERSDYG